MERDQVSLGWKHDEITVTSSQSIKINGSFTVSDEMECVSRSLVLTTEVSWRYKGGKMFSSVFRDLHSFIVG